MIKTTELVGFGGYTAAAAGGGLSNSYSLEWDTNEYLSYTMGAGDRKKWAISLWVRTDSTSISSIQWWIGGATNEDAVFVDGSARVNFFVNNGTGEQWSTTTLSTGTWYHILVHWDSANATAGDRMRMWIDGSEVTAFDRDTQPAQNTDSGTINNSGAIRIGKSTNDLRQLDDDWALDEIAFFDGQLPAVTDVRDASTGKPKDLSGLTFGTEGFWLRFETAAAASVGTDSSGNSNTWTNNNFVDSDFVTDVP